jgi:hypothetical protein
LDVAVHVLEDGGTKTRVFRKKTHTDQYLNFKSNHHLEHKRSVVRTLLHRANNLITEDKDKRSEILHIQEALTANDYPSWTMNIPQRQAKQSDQRKINNSQGPSIGIPYIRGLSETLGRTFKKHGITMFHKPVNTLKANLVRPKDKTTKEKKSGVIYQITCSTCLKQYIGETARPLGKRLEEHKKLSSSAIKEHIDNTGHIINWQNTKILDREQHDMKRKIKEAFYIRKHKPALNRDTGLELSSIYTPFWLCDNTVSHNLRTTPLTS